MNKKELDYAWLAGFVDADGYFTCAVWERRAKKTGTPNITIAPRIGASQMESRRNVLDRCVEITGCGKVYVKKELSNKLASSLQATWIVSKMDEILKVCNFSWPSSPLSRRPRRLIVK